MEDLLAKYFSGEATQDEISLVESWRSESKANAKLFFESKIIWSTASTSEQIYRPDILNSILNESTAENKSIQHFLLNTTWTKYAAAAVLAVAIGLLFILNNTQNDFATEILADGSEITLHGASGIDIVQMNESMREVKLTGKAYFDIERDESRPFIIHTPNATIKVLGTSFVIDSDAADTDVRVESGLVELSKDGGALSVNLKKGEMGFVSNSNKGIIKKENDDANYMAWKTKILTFDDSQINDVIEVLEDVYGLKVQLEDPSFSNCKLTAKINKKKAKDAIEIIARTFNVEYEIKRKTVILKGKGC